MNSGIAKPKRYTPKDIDKFRERYPQSECYDSEIPGVKFLHRTRLKTILHMISKAASRATNHKPIELLEIGCGDGYVLKEIERKFPTAFNFTGIDISKTALRRAKNLCQARLIKADAQKIPINLNQIDITICTELIEHLPEDIALLKEVHRILKPSSFLILTTPNFYTFENITMRILGRKPAVTIPEHLREYSYNELTSKIKRTGFNILEFQSIGFYIPKIKRLFFRSKTLTKMMFFLARSFPKMGRIFMILAEKK